VVWTSQKLAAQALINVKRRTNFIFPLERSCGTAGKHENTLRTTAHTTTFIFFLLKYPEGLVEPALVLPT